MSAEAGGVLGVALLLAAAVPLVLIAIKILLIGGACAAAVAAAVAGARGLNKLARARHAERIKKLIDRQRSGLTDPVHKPGLTIKKVANAEGVQKAVKQPKANTAAKRRNALAESVTKHREKLLESYEASSRLIEKASEAIEKQRSDLIKAAKRTEAAFSAGFEELSEKVASLNDANRAALDREVGRISSEARAQTAAWKTSVTKALAERREDFGKRLERIESVALKNEAGREYAEELYLDAKELYDSLSLDPDAEKYVPGRLGALKGLVDDYTVFRKNGQHQSMIATATALAQQTMETIIKLDAERHREQLMRESLTLAAAELRALTENGGSIDLEQGEQLPHDADYWAENALAPLTREAKQLLDDADGAERLTAAKLETLSKQLASSTHAVNEQLTKARQAYINCYLRLELIKKAQKGFNDSGWKTVDYGFEGGDYRRSLVMRFKNAAGATADLVAAPVYDPVARVYNADVRLERHDPGVIDEKLREDQLDQIKLMLKKHGVNVGNIKCNKLTAGKNSIRTLDPKRFSRPGVRRAR